VAVRTARNAIQPYPTRDGSLIRELMHPAVHGNRAQSLAEAEVPPGGETRPHRHQHAEEIYHVTAGEGRMVLGKETFAISVGDTVCIPPGTRHSLRNTGDRPLTVLCCCSPPYRHDDTILDPAGATDAPDP
jgi:mannose-6-phosphate isomerase-like protein (cupin superfamily)